jgi:hypothetical protein
MPGVYSGAGGTVVGIDRETGTIRVRLAGDDKAEAAWTAARREQESEIEELTADLEACTGRVEAAVTPAERAEARRRLGVVRARVHGRLANWRAGVVVVDGHLIARPGTADNGRPANLATAHLGYAYARTTHKAQGATCDVLLLNGSDARGREAAYVALSRHRKGLRLYLLEAQAPGDLERHQAPRERSAAPLDDFTGRVARSEAQRTATETMTRQAVERRRGVEDLAARPADELAGERAALEATLEPRPVEQAAPEVPTPDRRAAWLADVRGAAERERAARQAVRVAAREAEARRAERERLADLRATERAQERRQG